MKGLYLEFEALQKMYVEEALKGISPDLIDVIRPEGFNPDQTLGEVNSIIGSPLNPAQELSPLVNQPGFQINPSFDTLATISAQLTEVISRMGLRPDPQELFPGLSLNPITNALTVTTELVRMEPKKVELGIKDISALDELVKKFAESTPTKTETTGVATGTVSPVPAQTSGVPKDQQIDISVFTKTLQQQEEILSSEIQKVSDAGGSIGDLFLDKYAEDGTLIPNELTQKYEASFSTAVEEAKKNLGSPQETQPSPTASQVLPAPVTSTLTIAKEVVAPNFNKEIASGLTAVAGASSQMVAQNNIVNQNTTVSPSPTLPPAQENKPFQLTGGPEAEPQPEQPPQPVVSNDPLLATTMMQMLNLMKSGQLKVKLS